MADTSFPNSTEERIREHICNHETDSWSKKWGFHPENFLKLDGTPDGEYDIDSLMHYDSFDSCADLNRARTNPWGADFLYPLVQKVGDQKKILPQRFVPSKGDVARVKKLYPWEGA